MAVHGPKADITSPLRQAARRGSVGIWLVCAGLLAATPLVADHFPDYLAGYAVQIPALIALVIYVHRFDLWDRYRHWAERGALLLCFAIPLANTFILKAVRKVVLSEHILLELFRPTILLLLALAAFAAWHRRSVNLPMALRLSIALAVAGWLVSSVFSADPMLSLGYGFFDAISFWLALYVLLSVAPDRRFLLHAAGLFLLGFSLVTIAQASVILARFSADTLLGIPAFASEFLRVKMDTPLMISAGDNGLGNVGNFASLWCLVCVFIAGAAYAGRWKALAWCIFAVLMYAGLLIYPRSALGAVALGLVGLWLYRLATWRSASIGILVSLALIAAIHVSPTILSYYTAGIASFAAEMMPESWDSGGSFRAWIERHAMSQGGQFGQSGIDRAEAWASGWRVATQNPLTGVGFGVYPKLFPQFTAPHSMALQRIDDGGILSLLSLALLVVYCFYQSILLLMQRPKDMIGAAAIIAVSAFFAKGLVFGAPFAIMGLIPWGFAAALCLALFLSDEKGCPA